MRLALLGFRVRLDRASPEATQKFATRCDAIRDASRPQGAITVALHELVCETVTRKVLLASRIRVPFDEVAEHAWLTCLRGMPGRLRVSTAHCMHYVFVDGRVSTSSHIFLARRRRILFSVSRSRGCILKYALMDFKILADLRLAQPAVLRGACRNRRANSICAERLVPDSILSRRATLLS